jgi:hypothetical protein
MVLSKRDSGAMLNNIFNLRASRAGRENKRQKRDQLLHEFKAFDLGRVVLDWAEENGVAIHLQKLSGLHGYCAHSGKKIVLAADDSMGRLISTLAHELRHAWQILEAQHPVHFHLKAVNPFAETIMTRFMEADALSFEDFFMTKYLSTQSAQETFPDLMQSDPALQYRLQVIALALGNKATDIDRRRMSFEFFFLSRHQDDYDQRSADVSVIDGWWLTKLASHLLNKDQRPRTLKEENLTDMGRSAWGECEGQNFLEMSQWPLDITNDLYTGYFQNEVMDYLRKISTLPFYEGLNVIQMKNNGQQRPLIKLGK